MNACIFKRATKQLHAAEESCLSAHCPSLSLFPSICTNQSVPWIHNGAAAITSGKITGILFWGKKGGSKSKDRSISQMNYGISISNIYWLAPATHRASLRKNSLKIFIIPENQQWDRKQYWHNAFVLSLVLICPWGDENTFAFLANSCYALIWAMLIGSTALFGRWIQTNFFFVLQWCCANILRAHELSRIQKLPWV